MSAPELLSVVSSERAAIFILQPPQIADSLSRCDAARLLIAQRKRAWARNLVNFERGGRVGPPRENGRAERRAGVSPV